VTTIGTPGDPGNVVIGEHVYIETSYAFAPCLAEDESAIVLGDASGAYDQATFVLGPRARVVVGPYSVLNCHLVCEQSITMGVTACCPGGLWSRIPGWSRIGRSRGGGVP